MITKNKFVLSRELSAGFLVFLITLPLCIGIAIASGFPPIAGIFTSIVGGIVTGFLGGSPLTIKGAPAGMIVIVLAAVQELTINGDPLSGYKRTLAVCVVAGLVQIIFGKMKLGKFSEYIPESVIHGMIAAIGVIVIGKQLHTVFGVVPTSKNPLSLLAEIPHSISQLNPQVFLIGALSLFLMYTFTIPKISTLFRIPSALVVMVSTIALSMYFDIKTTHEYIFMGHNYEVSNKYLIHLPSSILSGINFPDFSALLTWQAWKHVLLFSLVGSIESLLTVKATDKMSSTHSNVDKDLVATGAANSLVGLIGGLPMISEVSRSKANIDSGAQTFWSNFIHGALILISVAAFAGVLELIPTAALAGILVFIGIRLAAPKHLYGIYKESKEAFLIYSTTLIVTLAVDLLVGVGLGIILSLIFSAFKCKSVKSLFKPKFKFTEYTDHCSIEMNSAAVLSSYPKLKSIVLDLLDEKDYVSIDYTKSPIIEKEYSKKIDELCGELGTDKIRITGLFSEIKSTKAA